MSPTSDSSKMNFFNNINFFLKYYFVKFASKPKLFSMKNLFNSLLIFSFLASGLTSFGQSTSLIYKKKGKLVHRVVLTISNDAGRKNLNPVDFKKSDNLYFIITPEPTAKKQYFKNSYVEDYFLQISIEQDGNKLTQNNPPVQLTEGDKITKVILSFPKKDIKLYSAFQFVNKIDKSSPVTLKEIFFPSFDKYKKVFGEAQEMMGNKKYISAFDILYKIEKDAQSNPEIKAYSFYNKATIELPKHVIKYYTDSLYNIFLKKHKIFLKQKSKPLLDSCNSILQTFIRGTATFQPYLQTKEDGIPNLKAQVLKIRNKMDSKYNADKRILRQSSMALLETANYSNYKFFLFVDILSRMLVQTDSLEVIDGIVPLNINLLNKFPKKTEELVNTGWFNDFNVLVSFLNDNIKQQKVIFDPAIISHMKQLSSEEKQPYFEIFSAFNSLESDPNSFYTNMNQAIVKCTDSTLLRNMDT